MSQPKRQRTIWSPRRTLISLHNDLLKIDRLIVMYADLYPDFLTPLEKRVICLEDRKFFSHKGVHLKAILRELLRGATFRKPYGASTVDMQFVRTATGYRDRTLRRKLYEMLLAGLIQYRYSKVTILRSYLANAYLGWGRRGVEQVASQDFGEMADYIDGLDAAKLASYLVFPRPSVISNNWERKVLRRANYVESIYIRHEERLKKSESRIFSKVT